MPEAMNNAKERLHHGWAQPLFDDDGNSLQREANTVLFLLLGSFGVGLGSFHHR